MERTSSKSECAQVELN